MAGRLSSRHHLSARERSGGQGRTGATRSRAQGSLPEHGEHGEDRTLTVASTMALSRWLVPDIPHGAHLHPGKNLGPR